MCIGDSKKAKIQSLQLAKNILEGVLPIGAEDEPEDVDEDSPARVGRCSLASYIWTLNRKCVHRLPSALWTR